MARKKDSNNGCGYIILIVILIAALPYIYPIFILLAIGVIIYYGIKWGLPYLQKKQFQEKKQPFLQSSEYQYIQQFAKKYQGRESEDELNKLGILLETKEWKFSSEELKILLSEEQEKQYAEVIKRKILETNPITLGDFVKGFIEVCGEDKNRFYILLELLRSNRLDDDLSEVQISDKVSQINTQMSLDLFEKRLLGGDNQLTLEDIDGLSGYDFESFLKDLFSKMGYQVEQTKLSGDQGADVVVTKFGEKTVIQAKRYSSSVGNWAVQEIMAAISLYKAQKGMVITNNYFTKSAIELAEANNIEMINREGLKELIEKYW